MALYENTFTMALLVAGYSSVFVASVNNCIPESVYSTSCLNRTDAHPADAKLCETSLAYQVLDRKAGLVAFSLLLPFNEPNTTTEVTIYALQSSEDVGCSLKVEGVHSRFTLTVDRDGLKQQHKNGSDNVSCHPSQMRKLEWKSSYLFTGCYQVDLSLNYNCQSKPFRIESDFIKDVFADLRLPLLTKPVGGNMELIFTSDQLKNDCNNPLLSSPCVCLSLHRDDDRVSSNWKWKHMVYANRQMEKDHRDGDSVSHCQWFRQEHGEGELVNCSCIWTEGTLECMFIDVPPGKYSIELDIMDTRCNRGTIWTESWDESDEEPCLWKHEGIIVANNTQSHWPFDATVARPFSSPWLISIVALTTAAIGISVYWRWRRRSMQPLIPRSLQDTGGAVDVRENLLGPPKVLLLYARDCEPFMSVMAPLRRLLRDNINAQVYDIWEDKTHDQIDTQGDIWTSRYLFADNVKVVLVATPISRRIEDALMNGHEIHYDLPDSRDETFLFAFITAISLAPKIREPCNKFIVVRLHHGNCSEDVLRNFSTNSTIYTLPTHLQKLILHLLESQSVNVAINLDKRNTESFCSSIEVYEKFVSSFPGYADEMLNILANG